MMETVPYVEPPPVNPRGVRWPVFCWAFGVILPVICVLLAGSPLTAETVGNPLPRPINALLILLVSATLGYLMSVDLTRITPGRATLLSLLAGSIATTSGLYALYFAPFFPLGVLGLVIILGLLVLTPPLSFVAVLLVLRRARLLKRGGAPAIAAFAVGALVTVGLLFVPEIREQRRAAMFRAVETAGPGPEQIEALAALRGLPDEEILEAFVSQPERGLWFNGGAFEFWGRGRGQGPRNLSAETYFRITGRRFDLDLDRRGPIDRRPWANRAWDRRDSESNWETFSPWWSRRTRDSGLKLSASTVESSIDAVGASAHVRWSFVVRNEHNGAAEGWFDLVLPEGAVVSRATLRVGDVHREAAFAVDETVRNAYFTISGVDPSVALDESTTTRLAWRQDPLLVREVSPRRVRLRFSPVPPLGSMRFRIGISVPLEILAPDRARLILPGISYGNVAPTDTLEHEIWVDTAVPVRTEVDRFETIVDAEAGTSKIYGTVDEDGFPGLGGLGFGIERPEITRCVADDRRPSRGDDAPRLVQTLAPAPAPTSARVVVAIDASTELAGLHEGLAEVLAAVPADLVVRVIIGGDRPITLAPKDAIERLRTLKARGGFPNEILLRQALEEGKRLEATDVVWLHGAQAHELAEPVQLGGWSRAAASTIVLHDLSCASGRNRATDPLSPALDRRETFVGRRAAPALATLLARLGGKESVWRRTFATVSPADVDGTLERGSGDLVRIEASERVRALAVKEPGEAARIGIDAKIVTPITSAVCLERPEQYDRFGLTASDGGELPHLEVPTIPEPEEWMMIALAAILLAVFLRRGRGA
ncbi:MAG: hypothetical protein R3F20_03600 [Planctomycetota bacterium]